MRSRCDAQLLRWLRLQRFVMHIRRGWPHGFIHFQAVASCAAAQAMVTVPQGVLAAGLAWHRSLVEQDQALPGSWKAAGARKPGSQEAKDQAGTGSIPLISFDRRAFLFSNTLPLVGRDDSPLAILALALQVKLLSFTACPGRKSSSPMNHLGPGQQKVSVAQPERVKYNHSHLD